MRRISDVQWPGSFGAPSASTALKNGLDLASAANGSVVRRVIFAFGWAWRMRSKAGNASTISPMPPSLITSTFWIGFIDAVGALRLEWTYGTWGCAVN